jgi:hypothetical protein
MTLAAHKLPPQFEYLGPRLDSPHRSVKGAWRAIRVLADCSELGQRREDVARILALLLRKHAKQLLKKPVSDRRREKVDDLTIFSFVLTPNANRRLARFAPRMDSNASDRRTRRT